MAFPEDSGGKGEDNLRGKKKRTFILRGKNNCIDQAVIFSRSELVMVFETTLILFSKHFKNIFYIPSTELGIRYKKKK